MIQGKWFAQGSDLREVLAVRGAVFSREQDPLDAESWNVLVYQDEVPAACGRLWWRDGAFRLGDLGVLEAYRGRKLGDLVLRLLLFKAQGHYAREVRLACPESLCGFFARLGFRPDPDAAPAGNGASGAPLTEMVLPGDEINLDSCASCKKASCPNRVS